MTGHDDISFIERHIEKGVFLLCLLLLVYALGHWVWHSPRKIDGVGPDEIDQKLLKSAKQLKQQMDRATPEGTQVPDYGERIAQLQEGPYFEAMLDLVPGHPSKRGYSVPVKRPVVLLAKVESRMPAPQKPLAWAGYRVPHKDLTKDPKKNPKDFADVPGVHVALFYPWGQLKANWMQEFQDTRIIMPRFVTLKVQVRVQEALGNGEFGPERDLGTLPCQKVGADGKPIPVPQLPPYNGQNAEEVNEVIAQLEPPLVQGVILRPDYWPIWHAASEKAADWRNNLPKVLWPAAKEPLAQRMDQERTLIWFHYDFDREGLASRKSYRYKAKLVMLNPLLTHDELVDPKKPKDAQTATLATPWSPWSEPVRVTKTTSFLLTGSSPLSRPAYVTVTVFAHALGKPVSRSFKVSAGQAIGQHHEQADYSTGAIVVDLTFDRYFYSGSSPVGRETAEMLYLDDDGQLGSRIYVTDRAKFDDLKRRSKQGTLNGGAVEMFEGTIARAGPKPGKPSPGKPKPGKPKPKPGVIPGRPPVRPTGP